MPTYRLDPDEQLDYSLDWSEWLVGNDTISSVEWGVPDGLTQPREATQDGSKATIWLAGGEVGELYSVVCTVVTELGRTGERTFHLKVQQK